MWAGEALFVFSPFAENDMKQEPTILVIFGATGDLVRRKIVPALWHLYTEGALPSVFSIVGFSRRDLTQEQFQVYVGEMLAGNRTRRNPKKEKEFLARFRYARGFFEKEEAYHDLGASLAAIEQEWGTVANKLLYLAVTPDSYKTVLINIARSGLARKHTGIGGWTRIIVEKPFGKDADTAMALDTLLGELFAEDQIYRIDHYLAKEMIQNILAFRFSNNLFERNWGAESIERIDIRLWEKIGVEERGSFYDGVGALRDVGQNHLLQMLALVTMDRPDNFGAPALRRRRADVLKGLRPPEAAEIVAGTARAQYEGYRMIRGVAPDSATETYFKIGTILAVPRWKGVGVTLESGKRMHEQRKDIEITFRHPSPCMCPPDSTAHYRNRMIISLEPEERIIIHFWSKKPGFAYALEERTLAFVLRQGKKRMQYVEEYKKLLLDCITGDQTLFVSTEEVKHMWRFIDPIQDAWRDNQVPLLSYAPDTDEAVLQGVSMPPHFSEVTPPKKEKRIGFIGLGKMGKNMAVRLLEHGWHVAAYDKSDDARKELGEKGADVFPDIPALVRGLKHPRLIWLMVPAGQAVDDVLFGPTGYTGVPPLYTLLEKGDTVVDGGNSFYQDSMRRGKKLKRAGVYFLDAGVSGGPGGARNGACLMVGGDHDAFRRHEDVFQALAGDAGLLYAGASGTGHFVKMIHNGIEYGMMQAIAEGFAVMKKAPFRLDLKKIAEMYNRGSVVESRLIAWLRDGFAAHGEDLKKITGSVGHTGEGEWTVKTAKKLGIQTPIIKGAYDFRVRSKKHPSYIGKILSALRNQFGGHSVQ
ncbi:MAG: glucose-6-phosphate dehydrogenase [Patescibacteria group bacterium]